MTPPNSTHPRHFATRALEAFDWSLAAYLAQGYPKQGGDLSAVATTLMTVRLSEIIFWMERAIKFIGPENGEFIERMDLVSDSGIDFPKLPFDVICLEYMTNCSGGTMTGMGPTDPNLQPDRACVLAFYPTEDTPLCRLATNTYGPCENGEFIVAAAWGRPGLRHGNGDNVGWGMGTSAVLVTPKPMAGFGAVYGRTDAAKRIGLHALVSAAEDDMVRATYDLYGEPVPDSPAFRCAINDLGNEAMAICELCNVLACTNVTTSTIAAPTFINRKRERKGKRPFFEYKILEIAESQERHESMGGRHASPRLHYRRGHIRRLSDGKKTWVRPCMVGEKAKGIIVKDYDTRLLAGSN